MRDKIKELLFESFKEGNKYARMPEDDYTTVKEDFERWYNELSVSVRDGVIN